MMRTKEQEVHTTLLENRREGTTSVVDHFTEIDVLKNNM
jgi:hypothetical protein